MRLSLTPVLLVLFEIARLNAQTLGEAERLWKAHEYQSAVKVFDALIAANPKNADYRVRYGQFFFERYDPEEAVKLFSEAIEIDPKNARAHLGLATVLAEQFSGKANESADKALELDPKLHEAHALKARIALEDDDPKKAAEEADAALAIDAGDVEAFTAAVADFDSLTRLDAWKTTLLVGAACAVHAVHAAAASAAADSHACTGGGCWRPLIPRLPAV